MELTNEFTVQTDVERAWKVLTDIERIAPCMPGAQLQEIEGDDFHGVVKVKVGPITAEYKGTARFLEQDAVARRAVIQARARDTRGQGNANATITAQLTSLGDDTQCTVVTDLMVTGRVAQFGRGVMAEVTSKLMRQFVECLESTVLAQPAAAETAPAPADDRGSLPGAGARGGSDGAAAVAVAEPAAPPAASPGPRRVEHSPSAPVDLLEVAGGSVARRMVPVLLGLAGVLLLRRARRRRRQPPGNA